MPEIVKTFPVYGNKLEITAERDRYNESRHLFVTLARETRDAYAQKYDENITSLKTLVYKNYDLIERTYRKAAEKIVGFFSAKGIYGYDVEKVLSEVLRMVNIVSVMIPFEEAYEEITEDEAEKDAYRTARRQNRSRYYGYSSYDLTHTVMNKAGAATKNALMGAAHGAFNLVAKGVSAAGAAIKMSSIFNDPDTRKSIVGAVFDDIYDAQDKYDEILAQHGLGKVEFVTQEEGDEARAIMNNINNGVIPREQIKQQLFVALKSNPYDFNVYEYAITHYGDENGEITAVADYHHIDLTEAKSLYIESLVPEQWENEEHAIKTKEKVLLEMKRLSVPELPVLNKINADLKEFDRIARTYKNILFPTREDRANAERQDNELATMTKGLSGFSREESISLKNKILSLGYVEQLVKVYIGSIDSHIFDVENDTAYNMCSPAANYNKQQLVQLISQLGSLACSDEIRSYYQGLINEQIKQRDDVMLSELCAGVYTADEALLKEMRNRVEASDASAEMKQKYYDILTKRTEDIWSSQDGRIFDDILRNTDANDANAIQASIARINESGRTESKQEYIDALNSFNSKNIKKVHWFSFYKSRGFIVTFGLDILLFAALFIVYSVIKDEEFKKNFVIVPGLAMTWMIVHMALTFSAQKLWMKMTVKGSAINPALISKFGKNIKEVPRPDLEVSSLPQNNVSVTNANVVPMTVPAIVKAQNNVKCEVLEENVPLTGVEDDEDDKELRELEELDRLDRLEKKGLR